MKIGMKKTVEVDIKTVSINAKIRDEGFYTFTDKDGEVVKELDGCYVPSIFPGDGGDYLELDIDLETGQILNWPKLNIINGELRRLFSENEE